MSRRSAWTPQTLRGRTRVLFAEREGTTDLKKEDEGPVYGARRHHRHLKREDEGPVSVCEVKTDVNVS